MTDVEVFTDEPGELEPRASASLEETRRRWIPRSARVAVWGVIAGLGAFLTTPILQISGLSIAAGCFAAAGLGTLVTSALVMKDLKRASWPLKLASVVGLPFGAALTVGGICGLLVLPPFSLGLPFQIFGWTLPTGLLLGVTLMILLLAGFFSHAFFNRSSTWED